MGPMAELRTVTPEEAAPSFPALLEEDLLVPLLVTGGSMVPFLRHRRDVVYIRGARYQSPRVGDVILFYREGGHALVLYRVLRRDTGGSFQAGGDGRTWTEHVSPKQILGVVTRISRDGGRRFRPDGWTSGPFGVCGGFCGLCGPSCSGGLPGCIKSVLQHRDWAKPHDML